MYTFPSNSSFTDAQCRHKVATRRLACSLQMYSTPKLTTTSENWMGCATYLYIHGVYMTL